MRISKRFTALTIAAVLALTAVSCGGDGAEPVGTAAGTTVETTTAETTVETTVVTTTAAAPETEPVLPELDLASEDGLLYRLMDMTYDEIQEEFGKDHTVTGGANDFGDLSLSLQWNDETRIQISFLYSDHFVDDPDWDWFSAVGGVTPSYVVLHGGSISAYPGIKESMTAAEVAKIIPCWDAVRMWDDTILYTYVYLNGYTLSVSWTVGEEHTNELKAAATENNSLEQARLRQAFADEFAENFGDVYATVSTVTVSRDEVAEHVIPDDPEYVDPADELALCTVYQVTSDEDSYMGPFHELLGKATADLPRKIALSFTDLDGLTVIMDISENAYVGASIYNVTRILKGGVDIVIPHSDGFRYVEGEFSVVSVGDMIAVCSLGVFETEYYVIHGDEYDILRNNVTYTGFGYELTDGGDFIGYTKSNWGFIRHYAMTFEDIAKNYESDEDIYTESGQLKWQKGKGMFVPDSAVTFGEWFGSDSFTWKDQRDKYGAETFAELAEIYEGLEPDEKDEF